MSCASAEVDHVAREFSNQVNLRQSSPTPTHPCTPGVNPSSHGDRAAGRRKEDLDEECVDEIF
jgi:hypothetical protein